MAFPASSGWNNLPNGVWSPTIFSQKAQLAFRKTAVAEDITNSSYFGEIANYGDSVRIIKEPEIAVRSYTRGKQIVPQELEDEDYTLVIDQANEFAFQIEDIEAAHSHVDFMDMASDRAAYKLKDAYDEHVLGYMTGYYKNSSGVWTARTTFPGTKADSSADSDEFLAANKLDASDFGNGTNGQGIVVGVSGTYDATPLQILNRINRMMNENSVPQDGRWVVFDPVIVEKLMDENSKLVNADYNTGTVQTLANGRLGPNKIRGFRVYESNNLPYLGTGPGTVVTTGTRTASNVGFILAGHDSAVATASQINKTEKFRSHDTFADVVRGLHMFGRKILRSEALYRAAYNVNA
jgi:hypothetical protein